MGKISNKKHNIEPEILHADYLTLLTDIKDKIQQAKTRAYLAVTREINLLYWEIGQLIATRQKEQGWGAKVIERLAHDLCKEVPNSQGYSVRNLKYMLKFYLTYDLCTIVQQLAAQIPWTHNLVILDKVKDPAQREYYIRECILNGWSRNVLIYQIDSDLYGRDLEDRKQTNFDKTLPQEIAVQAQEIFKDEFSLEFLGIQKTVQERELENRMLAQIRDVLIEFGHGFAFLGNQYKVKVEEDEYFIDLLFYHRSLQCMVAVELKAGKFIPEYAGKMNFYLNILDKFVKLPHENPTLGIILCRTKNRTTVEYALQGIDKPMGVAQYYLTKELPKALAEQLPSADQIEAKMQDCTIESPTSCELLPSKYRNILTQLQKFAKVSPSNKTLQQATGCSYTQLNRILNKLSQDGYIIKEKQGRYTLYSVDNA